MKRLSRNKAYEIRNAVTVAEVTTTIRKIPVEVELGEEDGMPKKCVVNLDTIMTIPKKILKERITLLSSEKLREVEKAIISPGYWIKYLLPLQYSIL